MLSAPQPNGDDPGARRHLWRRGDRPAAVGHRLKPTPPAGEPPTPTTGRCHTETQSTNDSNVEPQTSGDLHRRLSALRLSLAKYQQLKVDRLDKLTADINAAHDLITSLTAKVKEVEEDDGEAAIRQVISWVEIELGAPMRLERQEEIGEILTDVEEQCEHCCEMFDDVPQAVSRPTSPGIRAGTPLCGRQVTNITVSPPDGSRLTVSPLGGSRVTASPLGSRNGSPEGGRISSPALINGGRSSVSPTDGARRVVFSLDGNSGRSESPLGGSSGRSMSSLGGSTIASHLTPPRRSLVRSVVSACSRRLRRSGSLPARLPKTAIPAPLPAAARPRFFLRLSTDGSSSGGGGDRVVVETRPEVAPRLARLFAAGCEGPYRGAPVLRCVPGWWLQAGPAVSSTAGEAIATCSRLAEPHAPRLETRPGAVELLSVRLGADSDSDETDVGGDGGGGGWMVGPQFFIHLRSYSFTNVLGYVVEGLEHVARLASSGDPRAEYKPRRPISIVQCGHL